MVVKLYISPCPNDTFIFEALINRRVDSEGIEFETHYADIELLNSIARKGEADVCKISYAALPLFSDKYVVLDSGSALGRGNGPLVVSKNEVELSDPTLSVAIPGIHTTANSLLTRLYPHLTDKHPVLFSEIAESILNDRFDAGVLIHEGRFTYKEKGLRLIADLGVEWEKISSIPLPLGGIIAKRELGVDVNSRINRAIRRSLEYGWEHPDEAMGLVRERAQEMDERVMKSHIELFVNEFSLSLGEEGREAIMQMTGLSDDIFA